MFRSFVGWTSIIICLFFGLKILFWASSKIEPYEFTELPHGHYVVISVYPEHPGEAILEQPGIGNAPLMVKDVPKSKLVRGSRVDIEEK